MKKPKMNKILFSIGKYFFYVLLFIFLVTSHNGLFKLLGEEKMQLIIVWCFLFGVSVKGVFVNLKNNSFKILTFG